MQTNVNQRKHIHNNIRQKFVTQLKCRILTIKIGVIFLYRKLFFFARPNSFLYFWIFRCQISALNHQVLICRFLPTVPLCSQARCGN